jgi:SHS2 domain-containing protein
MGRWVEIDHTADLALRIWGDDLGDLLVAAARGVSDLTMRADTSGVPVSRCVQLEAPDAEALLVDWLNELLYLSEVDNVVFVDFDLYECAPTGLRARLTGLPLAEHIRSIKAATYHALEIAPVDSGLVTEVVFDV